MRPAHPATPGRGPALRGLVVAGLLALPAPVGAEPWGGITPGETTRHQLEALYGRPSRERMVVEEGRTTPEWTYSGDRAPRGLERMVVQFGLLRPQGFLPDVVRALTLYPKPRMFRTKVIAEGWGTPDAVATEEASGRPAMRWKDGLFVIMDKTGEWAEVMVFGPPQPGSRP